MTTPRSSDGQGAEPSVTATPPQAEEKPLSLEETLRNWERIGGFRRDGEAHRAGLLRVCAGAAVVAGVFSFCFFPIGLIGLVVGLITWRTACCDLDRMANGFMDMDGFHGTEKARSDGHAGMMLCLMGLLFGLIVFGRLYWVILSCPGGFGLGL